MSDMPKGWSQKSLSELLDNAQINRVTAILNGSGDDIAKTRALKDYLNQFREQLEAKGVLPDFLAYAIMHVASNPRIGSYLDNFGNN